MNLTVTLILCAGIVIGAGNGGLAIGMRDQRGWHYTLRQTVFATACGSLTAAILAAIAAITNFF
jgi:hypothetical protein